MQGTPSLELPSALPSRIVVGKPFEAPVVVNLAAPSSQENSLNLNGVWMYVSLMSADRKEILAPPREDLLRGKRVDSIHPVKHGRGRTIGYAEFTDLAILKPGKYCFRINLMGISSSDRNSSGQVLPAVYTNAFEVVDTK